jgi:type I restriction enzyme S subunit
MIRLRHVAEINPPLPEFDSLGAEDDVTFVPLEAVWSGSRLDLTRTRPKAEVSTGYVRFKQGDILVPKVTPTFQAARSALAVQVPTKVGTASTEVHVVRTRPGTDPRFLTYVFLSAPFLDEGVAFFQGVAGLQRVPDLFLRNFRVADLALVDQRRIADFLDDQVSRIEQAVRLRREQVSALERRVAVAMDVALVQRGWEQPTTLEAEAVRTVPDGWRVARLSQVLRQLTNGYVGPTRDILMDEGVRYIQGMHIKGGAIHFDRRHFFVGEAWHAARPRIHLRKGDVLIVQTGDIGRVAVVPPDFGEASCHALQIARVHEHVLSGEYLGAFLGSSFGYHSLLSRATGALHPHLEGGIRSVPVVVPPHDVQRDIVDEVGAIRASAQEAQGVMRQQIDLLAQRKRSLITAAVTGEFDVTTASGRGV